MTSGKNCPWCGKENPVEAETCFSCDTLLTGHDDNDGGDLHRKAARSRTRRRVVYVGLGIVIVTAAAVGVWLGITGGDKTTQGDGSGTQSLVEATSTSSTEAQTTSSTEEIPDPTLPTAKFGEVLDFWGISMTVSSPLIFEDAEVQALVGDAVDVYVVSVTIKNTGDEMRDYNLFYWEALDDEGARYDATLYLEDQALDTGEIQPGETVTGNVGFELPKGKQVVSVTYSPMLADETAVWER